jgi:hypothetical protein
MKSMELQNVAKSIHRLKKTTRIKIYNKTKENSTNKNL